MNTNDFRSDTITLPTNEMKEAMLNAKLGDDVHEDDPTVKELENIAAQKLNKQAALFVPSGTFGNQLCIATHTQRGDEIILSEQSHIFKYEAGAIPIISGAQSLTIDTNGEYLTAQIIKNRIRENDIHYPNTKLICLENALLKGIVMPIDEMKNIFELAKKNNINIHLDGARIFNAAISLGTNIKEISQYTDSVMFCLSKGLSAPIGSLICGNSDFINKARKIRKFMGGGMRQTGIIAAAGIISLTKMIDRLKIDHDNAIYLGRKLSEIENIDINKEEIQINLVHFKIKNDIDNSVNNNLVNYLNNNGFKILPSHGGFIRLVTSRAINRDSIDNLIGCIKEYFSNIQ